MNKNCSKKINLSEFNGKTLDFWFRVSDEFGFTESQKTRVRVDTRTPELKADLTAIDKNRVKFLFEIYEDNFDRIVYMDNNELMPLHIPANQFKVLCNSLINGRCSATKVFSEGWHNLTFKISDKAGNAYMFEKEFTI